MSTTNPSREFIHALRHATTVLLERLMISAIFFISGVSKITAPAATITTSLGGPPVPVTRAGDRNRGGTRRRPCTRTGLSGRLAVALLATYCVAMAVFFYRAFADLNTFLHFFKDIAMAGGLLQIAAFGARQFSVDAFAFGPPPESGR